MYTPKPKTIKSKGRNQKGNLYVLYVGLIALLIGVFYTGASITLDAICQHRVKHALEAAALTCANNLSQIVINDPYWGYISLTDHPPIGSDTMAGDNEPLPVTGINTIIGTTRQELILAHAIGTTEAIGCAMVDVREAKRAQRDLEDYLRQTLASDKTIARDIDGNSVDPMCEAGRVFSENTRELLKEGGYKLESLAADLGYLNGASTTNTRISLSIEEPQCKRRKSSQRTPAFVNLPVKGESFYFAGLGEQSGLLAPEKFCHGNGEQVCSIVRLTAVLHKRARTEQSEEVTLSSPKAQSVESVNSFKLRACAQPFHMEDRTKPPLMALSLPHGLPEHVKTLRDLLTAQSLNNKIPAFTPIGGDFPQEAKATLKPDIDKPQTTVRAAFTRAYLDWIRAAHLNADIESVIAILDSNIESELSSCPSRTLLLGFDDNGKAQFIKPKTVPFRNQITQENQLYCLSLNSIQSSQYCWTFKLRDQVHRLGTLNGGKHAGQAMASIAYINELKTLTKRESRFNSQARFATKAGSRYDQSRLAVEIEISSPQHLSLAKSALEGGF